MSKAAPVTGAVPRVFNRRTLATPTITPALRQKVMGAYQYISQCYSFPTPDVRLGSLIEMEGANLTRTDYAEYEQTFNSVLLGTLLNSLICGSIIYFGPPGSGKTTTPEVTGQVLFGLTLRQIEEATIYGHPNLTEEKMTASFDIPKLMNGVKEVNFSRWVLEFFRMLDEVNRIPPETSAILMQAIDRRRVSYAGNPIDMPWGPISATANYYDAGNFEMTRPFMDRFGISVHAEGLSPQELDLLWAPAEELDRESFALSHEDREQVFAEIHSIQVEAQTLALLAHLTSGLSSCQLAGNHWYNKHKGRFGEQPVACSNDGCDFQQAGVVCSQITEQGLNTRGLEALRDYSRAIAWFLGRESVDNEIMKIAFGLVVGHRLSPSRVAMNGGESEDGAEILRSLFARATFDFADHVWGLGVTTFGAQRTVYDELDAFYEDIAAGQKTAASLLAQSRALLEKVDAMEDPAKWEILKSLHAVRQMIRAQA